VILRSSSSSRSLCWVVTLSLFAVSVVACAGAADSAGAPPAAAMAGGSLPKTCGERVSESGVSTAVAYTVQLKREALLDPFMTCTYEVNTADTGNIEIDYMLLDHVPSRSEVNDRLLITLRAFGGQIEPVTGVGDYAGWIVGAKGAVDAQGVWTAFGSKGKLLVQFTAASQVAHGDKTRMSDVVRKALG
jgi:hypothetical protein